MIWKDRKYINPRKRVFKNMDTDEILNLEIQDDPDNIEEESETPLNAHNLNLSQQQQLDDMSKTYKGTSITAPTVEGYGRINKIWGHTVEEGTGEKSPTNPYTLRCVGDDVNLFNKGTVTVNQYLNNQGAIQSVNTWAITDYIPCNPQEEYIVSGYTDIGGAPSRCYYDKNKTFISSTQHNQNSANMKFTAPANCYYFKESVYRTDLDTFKIQKGSIATPYTPFNGEGTVEIISKNEAQQSSNVVVTKPLCCLKGGDNIIAQDYIDYGKGVVHRECGYRVLNGTEAWEVSTATNVQGYYSWIAQDCLAVENEESINVVSNYFEAGAYVNRWSKKNLITTRNNTLTLTFAPNTFSSLEAFKDYLKNHNIILVYKRATPTEESIDCSNKIIQYSGKTTIHNRDGAEIEVSLTNNKAISGLNEDIKGNEIQTITNENGTAIKYPNGTMICTKRLTGNSSQSLWVSPLYYQDIANGNWAEPFTAINSVNATAEGNQFWCNISAYSLSSAGTTRLTIPSANKANYGISIIAIGRWK